MKLKSSIAFVIAAILISATMLEILPVLTSGGLPSVVFGRESAIKNGAQDSRNQDGVILREALEPRPDADMRFLMERTSENLFRAGSIGLDSFWSN